jgi:hypothetical protein
LNTLLERKRAGDELSDGPRMAEINDFLDAELPRLRSIVNGVPTSPGPDWERLDALFRETLAEAWRT